MADKTQFARLGPRKIGRTPGFFYFPAEICRFSAKRGVPSPLRGTFPVYNAKFAQKTRFFQLRISDVNCQRPGYLENRPLVFGSLSLLKKLLQRNFEVVKIEHFKVGVRFFNFPLFA